LTLINKRQAVQNLSLFIATAAWSRLQVNLKSCLGLNLDKRKNGFGACLSLKERT